MTAALFVVGFSAAAIACSLIALAVYRVIRDCHRIGEDEQA